MADRHARTSAMMSAVATVHGLPRNEHRVLCTCEKHKPGESTCQCRSCEMVREGRCTICGQRDEARIRANERARIAAFVRSPEADDLLHAAEQQPGWMNLAAAADGTYIDARTVLADAIEAAFPTTGETT